MISHRPTLATLVPAYTEAPAAFTKAGAVRRIVRGNLDCSARGKGNRARRRQICLAFMQEPPALPIFTDQDADILHDLMTEVRSSARSAAFQSRNFHD